MRLTSQKRESILRRLTEIEPELFRAEAAVRELRGRDPATAEVVTRGAALSLEKAGLERRLELDDAQTRSARETSV
jgi:Trp operon repressor